MTCTIFVLHSLENSFLERPRKQDFHQLFWQIPPFPQHIYFLSASRFLLHSHFQCFILMWVHYTVLLRTELTLICGRRTTLIPPRQTKSRFEMSYLLPLFCTTSSPVNGFSSDTSCLHYIGSIFRMKNSDGKVLFKERRHNNIDLLNILIAGWCNERKDIIRNIVYLYLSTIYVEVSFFPKHIVCEWILTFDS